MIEGKRFLYITGYVIPYPGLVGDAVTTYHLLDELSKALSSATFVLCLFEEAYKNQPDWLIEKMAYNKNVEIQVLKRGKQPSSKDYFKSAAYQESFNKFLAENTFDRILTYGWPCTQLLAESGHGEKGISQTVDLWHLMKYYRMQNKSKGNITLKQNFDGYLDILKGYFVYPKAQKDALKKIAVNYNHAFHHAQWLIKKGAPVKYVPLPIKFKAKPFVKERIDPNHINVMMMGATTGLVSKNGLFYFVLKVLPQLRKVFANKLYLNYYGKFRYEDLPEKIADIIRADDNFIVKGFIDDINDAFAENDFFLVPSNAKIGFRTRIAESFSQSMFTIAAPANALGMPELKTQHNIVLADQPKVYVEAIKKALEDQSYYNGIREQALRTYEEKYHISNTIDQFLKAGLA